MNINVRRPKILTIQKFIHPRIGNRMACIIIVLAIFSFRLRLILGSSPARHGTAVTGVPFEDAKHLQSDTGIFIDKFFVNQSSSGFLYDVIREYGGCKKFYNDFYMNFVCPFGLVKTNSKGNEVNCNYYENKKYKKSCLLLS